MTESVIVALLATIPPTILAVASLIVALSNLRRIDRHMEACPQRNQAPRPPRTP
jgi:hypothetical protein